MILRDRPPAARTISEYFSDALPDHVLALVPSTGLGGGIEAYIDGVVVAIRAAGIEVDILPLTAAARRPSTVQKSGFVMRSFTQGRAHRSARSEILCFHPSLLPAAYLASHAIGNARIFTFFYGTDIWGSRISTQQLLRSARVVPVTISSYSSGALSQARPPLHLPPRIDLDLFDRLLAQVPATASNSSCSCEVLSVFRLTDYRAKGGPEVVDAIRSLRAEGMPIRLTIAGKDGANRSPDLDLLERHEQKHAEWLTVVRSPDPDRLAECYGSAHVFVLATRLRAGPDASGEGFGIVLAEAALAGLPVIAPTNDGGRSAMVEGLTGICPRDASVGALSNCLRWLVGHPDEAARLGQNGRVWARQMFSSERYQALVTYVLWGAASLEDVWRVNAEIVDSPRAL